MGSGSRDLLCSCYQSLTRPPLEKADLLLLVAACVSGSKTTAFDRVSSAKNNYKANYSRLGEQDTPFQAQSPQPLCLYQLSLFRRAQQRNKRRHEARRFSTSTTPRTSGIDSDTHLRRAARRAQEHVAAYVPQSQPSGRVRKGALCVQKKEISRSEKATFFAAAGLRRAAFLPKHLGCRANGAPSCARAPRAGVRRARARTHAQAQPRAHSTWTIPARSFPFPTHRPPRAGGGGAQPGAEPRSRTDPASHGGAGYLRRRRTAPVRRIDWPARPFRRPGQEGT